MTPYRKKNISDPCQNVKSNKSGGHSLFIDIFQCLKKQIKGLGMTEFPTLLLFIAYPYMSTIVRTFGQKQCDAGGRILRQTTWRWRLKIFSSIDSLYDCIDIYVYFLHTRVYYWDIFLMYISLCIPPSELLFFKVKLNTHLFFSLFFQFFQITLV